MRRRLFTILSAVSLVLCVAVSCLWVRSYRYPDSIGGDFCNANGLSTGEWSAGCIRGMMSIQVSVLVKPFRFAVEHTLEYGFRGPFAPNDPSFDNICGVRWGQYGSDSSVWVGLDRWRIEEDGSSGGSGFILPGHQEIVILPIYLLVSAMALFPFLWAISFRASRRRLRLGVCRSYGYDLRATPHHCPECGALAKQISPPRKNSAFSN